MHINYLKITLDTSTHPELLVPYRIKQLPIGYQVSGFKKTVTRTTIAAAEHAYLREVLALLEISQGQQAPRHEVIPAGEK